MTALGGPASKHTGHSLAFKEEVVNDQPKFCYQGDYKNPEERGTWNTAVPDETLAVHLSTSGSITRMGYIPSSSKPGRHVTYLDLSLPDDFLVGMMVHEVKHLTQTQKV